MQTAADRDGGHYGKRVGAGQGQGDGRGRVDWVDWVDRHGLTRTDTD